MIAELIHNSMLEYENLIAIKNGIVEKTYKEVNAAGLSIAKILLQENITKQNVGIIGDRNIAVYFGVLGSVYSSNAYVPINKKYPIKKINEIIDNADIRVVILSVNDFQFFIDTVVSIEKIELLIIPDAETDFSKGLNQKIFSGYDLSDRIESPISVGDNDNLYIIFTSGSTGKPKGVEVSHKNLNSFLFNMNEYYNLVPGYNASQSFDLSFDLSVSDIFFTWMKGGALCVLPEEEMYCPSDYIKRENINFWFSVPTLADFMNKLGVLKPREFPSLKYSLFCGEPLKKNTTNAWLNAAHNSTVENLYGPTETTISVSRYKYTQDDISRKFNNGIVPIGEPFEGQEMEIIDKNENIVSTGEIGELIISGSQVTKGYLNNKEKTNEVYKKMTWDSKGKTWYKTGDMVVYNEENLLEYIERKDKQIKIAGRRIEIGEIEHYLGEHGNLDGAIVVPFRDDSGIVIYLVAFVLVKLTGDEIREIQQNCMDYIEDIFFPKDFIYIEKVPFTVSGKIDRAALERNLSSYTTQS